MSWISNWYLNVVEMPQILSGRSNQGSKNIDLVQRSQLFSFTASLFWFSLKLMSSCLCLALYLYSYLYLSCVSVSFLLLPPEFPSRGYHFSFHLVSSHLISSHLISSHHLTTPSPFNADIYCLCSPDCQSHFWPHPPTRISVQRTFKP